MTFTSRPAKNFREQKQTTKRKLWSTNSMN
jgi:hypothetical protein